MRSAFTLIELLVVIAIIAILAAILFPVFAQVKRAAKDSVTISNLKQLGVAFSLYEEDSDDVLPAVTHSVGGEGQIGGWVFIKKLYTDPSVFDVKQGSLFPYVKSADVYQSPLDKDAKASGLSYAVNSCLSVWPVGSGVVPSKTATSAENPSGMMLLSEEAAGTGYRFDTDDGYFYTNNAFANWHAGGSATLFVDNHAKIVHPDAHRAELLYGDATLTGCP